MNNDDLFSRGIAEIIEKSSLEKRLKEKKSLRIKYGIDPNKKDIHLGHAVPIRKLRAFQELGHIAVFIIGDYTAQIGDPSEKEKTREPIARDIIKKNTQYFFDQAFKILDKEKTEIHLQSEWFEKINLEKIFEITSKVSMAQIMEHETFRKRLQKGQSFRFHEAIYPILQGYDSVMVKADVEIGGADQKFNLLMGRQMQKAYGQKEQDVIMMKYLIGLDGKEKMSKSLGNYIAFEDKPDDMYGKVMSIPDNLIAHYFELCTDVTSKGLEVIKDEIKKGKNPRDIKADLAKLIVGIYHSAPEAEEASLEFKKVFSKKESPTNIPTIKIIEEKMALSELIAKSKLVDSNSEIRRLIEQGGVEVDDMKITDPNKEITIKDSMLIRVGKRKFVKLEK